MKPHTLFGIRFDAVTAEQALERLVSLAKNAKAERLPAQLAVTVNVQDVVPVQVDTHELPAVEIGHPLSGLGVLYGLVVAERRRAYLEGERLRHGEPGKHQCQHKEFLHPFSLINQ